MNYPSNHFTLTFSQEDLSVTSQALQELPFRLAAPLIHKINQQIQEQLAAQVPAHSMEASE